MNRYREIFSKIENTLRAQSKLTKELFDSRFGEYKSLNYKDMSEDDIFQTIVEVVFYSGMRASIVSQRLPALEQHLNDFRKVKNYTKEDIDRILADPNTIHHIRKIHACIHNANEFDKLLKKYGSFPKYLESFNPLQDEANIDKLRSDLRSRFQYLGERTVNHFLTDLGLNVLKPDRVICRIFARLGFIDNETDIAQAIKVGKEIATSTEYPIRYIDIIFVKYGQMGKDESFGLSDGVCFKKNPRCFICGVKEDCEYYAGNYR